MVAKIVAQVSLASMPLRIEKATDDVGADLHTVCTGGENEPHAPVRVKQTVACPTCGNSASSHYGFPARARETADGLVVVSVDEIAEAKGKPITGRVAKGEPPVQINFHPREKVFASTVFSGSVNNLYPDKGGERVYAALHDALIRHPDVVAVFVWAPRSNNTTWVVEATGDGRLVASSLADPEAVRATTAIAPVELLDQESALMDQLIEGLISDYDPLAYANVGKQGVEELIASRMDSAVPSPATPAAMPAGTDMLAALQASVDKIAPKTKPTVKKTAAKKTAAKKAPAKKKALAQSA